MKKKNSFSILNLKVLGLVALLMIPLLVACTNPSSPDEDGQVNEVALHETENKAASYLDGRILNKYSGEGPDQLTFSNDKLLVSTAGNIPPFLPSAESIEDLQQADAYTYEGINLVDGNKNEFVVYYDGKELFNFHLNENNMLENKDGTVYSVNN